ncbi:MAG: hypothetical protein HQL27_01315 [Candidatus Omnitrophica bacterium]|nr:hypothetical protein [Candidatus Omnitrophota bacterium]
MPLAPLSKEAHLRVKAIHRLSREINGKTRTRHEKKLLELIRKHIDEIEKLWENKNKHFIIETGDLIVLCLELILENKASVNKVMLGCFARYEKKLSHLIKERSQ